MISFKVAAWAVMAAFAVGGFVHFTYQTVIEVKAEAVQVAPVASADEERALAELQAGGSRGMPRTQYRQFPKQ